jgi:hypothetical protein
MRRTNAILWTIQGLLALAFLFAGGMKLVTPTATLAPMIGKLPLGLIRFIGFCEVTGALGLILPGLFRIKTYLTPLAAAGLVIIMSGAIAASVAIGLMSAVTPPAVLGILALVVVYGRLFLAPMTPKSSETDPRTVLDGAHARGQNQAWTPATSTPSSLLR